MPTPHQSYTGRPLYQKLGLKEQLNCLIVDAPEAYFNWLSCPFPIQQDNPPYDFLHLFAYEQEDLEAMVAELLPDLQQKGMIWLSWPKKSAKVPTTVEAAVVRTFIRELGLIDAKVCSVSPVWTGLKVVIRKENRT